MEFLNIVAISGVDQYLAILYPLEYSTKVTRLISWLLIGLVWGFGVLASVLGSLKLVSLSSPWTSCRVALKTQVGEEVSGEQGCQMAKFDPFLSLDCARVEGVGAQSKERKGSNFAA